MPRPLPTLSPFLSWPPYLATPPARLADVMQDLEASDRWSAAEIAAGTQSQLMLLLEWAANNVPYYRKQGSLKAALKILRRSPERFDEQWLQLPLLTKETLRSESAALNAPSVPSAHLPLASISTSGSTGIPVEVNTTAVTRTVWEALAVREHLWQRRDFGKRLGVIRSFKPAEGIRRGIDSPDWGPPVARLYRTGPMSVVHIKQPVEVLVDWLRRFDPHYLLTYPSVAAALFNALGPGGRTPSLEELRLIAEPVDVEFERQLKDAWGVRITDIYSCNETGKIAQRCREHENLHVQGEGIFVEILNDRGERCAPGESGQVVLTSLHNLATPLIRYQIGDYATVGEPCGCGRASLVIGRVLGRVRNLAMSPDGKRYYPITLWKIRAVAPVRQAQWVQTALDAIELRAVLDRPLTAAETQQAADVVCETLGHAYRVTVMPVNDIARGPTGKFQEFLSLLPDGPDAGIASSPPGTPPPTG
ncbi:MAG: phenylacetate--CoA ligase family protein [Steroidobacteraceae bacterium]